MRRAVLAAIFAAAATAPSASDAAVLTPIYSYSDLSNPILIDFRAILPCTGDSSCTGTFGPITARLGSSNTEIDYDPASNLYFPGPDDSAALSVTFESSGNGTPVAGVGAVVENIGVDPLTGLQNAAGLRVFLDDGTVYDLRSPLGSSGPEFLGVISSASDITAVEFLGRPFESTFEGVNDVSAQLSPSRFGVPEPASIGLLGMGLLGMIGVRRQRKG